MARRLRSGYTTGACSAAAAKAAAQVLLSGKAPDKVEIPFPDGSRHSFVLQRTGFEDGVALASVIKDAGDDPDVTNGAEIVVSARYWPCEQAGTTAVFGPQVRIRISGGSGVGTVTKPGLAVKVGEPAINPVPRQMIEEAVLEAMAGDSAKELLVIVSVPKGDELAEKTLNSRLGIVGGLSILGTTGIVRPVSAEAWTATIEASLEVAKEAGLSEVVLSTGRTSEKGAQSRLNLPEEAYAMMGDYLEFSLQKAAQRGFARIYLAGMWAKVMKAALETPQTHVRHGALEVADGAALLQHLGAAGDLLAKIRASNTAREMYGHLQEAGRDDLIRAVCARAKAYAQKVSGKEVILFLVDSRAQVVEHV
ncbi:MAG: cobalt-precorrin-5B (C(1))-methyltransferase CbiD [Desulfobulbaceae bacterium]|nr:cobalt-precorrin-5B (C(1))-methyltransferase CbiD [Desulfobulbaceae bacterium]HIJ79338.1 cobalt-precorrin-5B (C(1))-methyltransferase [Deltaproteobacteria bacterium]